LPLARLRRTHLGDIVRIVGRSAATVGQLVQVIETGYTATLLAAADDALSITPDRFTAIAL